MYGKNESSIHEVMKNKEKICASSFVALQTTKVSAIAHDKVLTKVEKALNFWLEDMNKRRVPLFITLYYYFMQCWKCLTVRNLSIKIYRIHVCYMNVTFCHAVYGVQYYLWFHITTVGLGTYYPWILGSTCTEM